PGKEPVGGRRRAGPGDRGRDRQGPWRPLRGSHRERRLDVRAPAARLLACAGEACACRGLRRARELRLLLDDRLCAAIDANEPVQEASPLPGRGGGGRLGRSRGNVRGTSVNGGHGSLSIEYVLLQGNIGSLGSGRERPE